MYMILRFFYERGVNEEVICMEHVRRHDRNSNGLEVEVMSYAMHIKA